MENLYKQFCTEGFDEHGVLNKFDVQCPDNFNFAYDVVDKIAEIEPDRRAMVWTNEQGDERIFSFSDMSKASNKVANMLTDYGIKKGDKVIIVLKRHYEFWFTILALHKIGAVTIPATNLLTTKDIEYRTNAASVKHIICSGTCHITDYVDEAEEKCGKFEAKFIVRNTKEGWIDFDNEMEKYPDTFERVETHKADDMLAYFTSGTTGNPKMVMHDYSYPLAHIITAVHWHCVKGDGLHLTLAETGWGKAVWGKLYGQWLAGAGIFVYDFDKFVPHDLLEMIEKYKITTFCAPPTVYRFLIKEGMKAENLASLTHASTAGEALNEEVFKRFRDVTGLKLMEGFGQTETTLLLATLDGMEPKPGSMGKPSPLYNVDIVDEDLNSVDDGVVGEIVVRPRKDGTKYGLLKCYYRDEAKTNQVWQGGVYHTGDTAYRDEDGYYWYVGRTDDVIKASGYRIGPFEVESVLMEHPAVLECAVTGAPDPVRGQVVKATIVLTSQYQPSDELKKEIQNFVKKTTAPYKYPRIIDFVPELPKTISGKIKRNEIRNQDNN
ncbi:AMP-binding protein [Paludicola sp. MB14-C6]|uniref:AMP-binding protein n=1 Tax=Paludihabitans sp. MB14-C6 TaxID=3070656 RepID=UPI0027DE04C8|nr:AMP-binding protein [Paludicola sp. MB14-C6]WMJ23093.1 AMP-binding protein [Paludicola sp. MB14-C6]